ncbi:MAG TPA: NUDIX domain-containing protein [Phycisphaerae bacterium]|nr:NUDIX domain-containing protein [Phycisphaerae bacterium]
MACERAESAGGVVVYGDAILLVRNGGTASWGFPKGRVEEGETALGAALREIAEETGLRDLRLICTLGAYQRDTRQSPQIRKHVVLFLFLSPTRQAAPNHADVSTCRWVPLGSASEQLTYPEDAAFLREHRQHIRGLLRQGQTTGTGEQGPAISTGVTGRAS